jgi:hypothetical protein
MSRPIAAASNLRGIAADLCKLLKKLARTTRLELATSAKVAVAFIAKSGLGCFAVMIG